MLFIIFIVIFIVNRLPIVGQLFRVASTMFHELGHAFMTILTRGKIYGIILIKKNDKKNKTTCKEKITTKIKKYFLESSLLHNTEGEAQVGTTGWIPRVLVFLSGYPSEMGASLLLLNLYVHQKYIYMIYFLAFTVLFTFIFIRNRYGMIWLAVFGGSVFFAFRYQQQLWVQYYLLTITLICVIESIYSSFTILLLSITNRKNAGDATCLAKATFIPTVIWGILFFAFNSYILFWQRDLFQMIKITIPNF